METKGNCGECRLKILNVKAINFQGHAAFNVDLSEGPTCVVGANMSGKTSFGRAIAWVLAGRFPYHSDAGRFTKDWVRPAEKLSLDPSMSDKEKQKQIRAYLKKAKAQKSSSTKKPTIVQITATPSHDDSQPYTITRIETGAKAFFSLETASGDVFTGETAQHFLLKLMNVSAQGSLGDRVDSLLRSIWLGVGQSTSFFSASGTKRREIIEKTNSFTKLASMKEEADRQHKEVTRKITETSTEIDVERGRIDARLTKLDELMAAMSTPPLDRAIELSESEAESNESSESNESNESDESETSIKWRHLEKAAAELEAAAGDELQLKQSLVEAEGQMKELVVKHSKLKDIESLLEQEKILSERLARSDSSGETDQAKALRQYQKELNPLKSQFLNSKQKIEVAKIKLAGSSKALEDAKTRIYELEASEDKVNESTIVIADFLDAMEARFDVIDRAQQLIDGLNERTLGLSRQEISRRLWAGIGHVSAKRPGGDSWLKNPIETLLELKNDLSVAESKLDTSRARLEKIQKRIKLRTEWEKRFSELPGVIKKAKGLCDRADAIAERLKESSRSDDLGREPLQPEDAELSLSPALDDASSDHLDASRLLNHIDHIAKKNSVPSRRQDLFSFEGELRTELNKTKSLLLPIEKQIDSTRSEKTATKNEIDSIDSILAHSSHGDQGHCSLCESELTESGRDAMLERLGTKKSELERRHKQLITTLDLLESKKNTTSREIERCLAKISKFNECASKIFLLWDQLDSIKPRLKNRKALIEAAEDQKSRAYDNKRKLTQEQSELRQAIESHSSYAPETALLEQQQLFVELERDHSEKNRLFQNFLNDLILVWNFATRLATDKLTKPLDLRADTAARAGLLKEVDEISRQLQEAKQKSKQLLEAAERGRQELTRLEDEVEQTAKAIRVLSEKSGHKLSEPLTHDQVELVLKQMGDRAKMIEGKLASLDQSRQSLTTINQMRISLEKSLGEPSSIFDQTSKCDGLILELKKKIGEQEEIKKIIKARDLLKNNFATLDILCSRLTELKEREELLTICRRLLATNGEARTLAISGDVATIVEMANKSLASLETERSMAVDLELEKQTDSKPTIELRLEVDGPAASGRELPSKSQRHIVGLVLDLALRSHSLSGGIIIVDEPEEGLDEVNKAKLTRWLRAQAQQVLIMTNNASAGFDNIISTEQIRASGHGLKISDFRLPGERLVDEGLRALVEPAQ